MIDALAEGYRAPGLQQRLDDLESRKASLEQELTADPPPPVRRHPNLAQVYRGKVERLHEALADPGLRDEALGILRGLIERVAVHPAEDGRQIGAFHWRAFQWALHTKQSPSASHSRPLLKNVVSASSGVITIGSPLILKEVLSSTGTPVCSPNSRSMRWKRAF